jgi:hypothetical protein
LRRTLRRPWLSSTTTALAKVARDGTSCTVSLCSNKKPAFQVLFKENAVPKGAKGKMINLFAQFILINFRTFKKSDEKISFVCIPGVVLY